jgi:hypothetical protein
MGQAAVELKTSVPVSKPFLLSRIALSAEHHSLDNKMLTINNYMRSDDFNSLPLAEQDQLIQDTELLNAVLTMYGNRLAEMNG